MTKRRYRRRGRATVSDGDIGNESEVSWVTLMSFSLVVDDRDVSLAG